MGGTVSCYGRLRLRQLVVWVLDPSTTLMQRCDLPRQSSHCITIRLALYGQQHHDQRQCEPPGKTPHPESGPRAQLQVCLLLLKDHLLPERKVSSTRASELPEAPLKVPLFVGLLPAPRTLGKEHVTTTRGHESHDDE